MIEVAPADGPGLAELARESGAALSGLRLADGALISRSAEAWHRCRSTQTRGLCVLRGTFSVSPGLAYSEPGG